ncbi:MAG TPA: hypothetical protein VIL18_00875 [Longimicrobiales bacterium]
MDITREGAAFLPVFLRGAGLFPFLLAASASGGFAYGLIGRPLRAFAGGRYLAGMVTIAPYTAAVTAIVHCFEEGRPVFDPWTGIDWFLFGFGTVVFGAVIGHSWFAPDPGGEPPSPSEAASASVSDTEPDWS